MENDAASVRGRAQVLATQLHKETSKGASLRSKLAVTGSELNVREQEAAKYKDEQRRVRASESGVDRDGGDVDEQKVEVSWNTYRVRK
jgi:hypothetical protein